MARNESQYKPSGIYLGIVNAAIAAKASCTDPHPATETRYCVKCGKLSNPSAPRILEGKPRCRPWHYTMLLRRKFFCGCCGFNLLEVDNFQVEFYLEKFRKRQELAKVRA